MIEVGSRFYRFEVRCVCVITKEQVIYIKASVAINLIKFIHTGHWAHNISITVQVNTCKHVILKAPMAVVRGMVYLQYYV